MAADKRMYVVKETTDKGVIDERLVKATSQAAAIRHVVTGRFDAEVASTDDVVRLMEAGVKPVEARSE